MMVFKRKVKAGAIQQTKLIPKNNILFNDLEKQLKEIDLKINEMTREILRAYSVHISSALNQNKNFLVNFQKKWAISAAKKSAKWHQESLLNLYKQRQQIKIMIEKSNGTYWSNRIKRISITIISLIIFLLLIGFTYLSFLALLYLLPLCVIPITIYYFMKRSWRR